MRACARRRITLSMAAGSDGRPPPARKAADRSIEVDRCETHGGPRPALPRRGIAAGKRRPPQELAGPRDGAQGAAGELRGAKALEQIKADDARTLAEQRRITEIAAPPSRSTRERNITCSAFTSSDSTMRDRLRRQCGRAAQGQRQRAELVVSGAPRYVFPAKIPTRLCEEADGVLHVPGIGDDMPAGSPRSSR